jgi:DUF4097 and DUF4098 domain-containing protein YvlB
MTKACLFLATAGLLCAAEGSFERTLKTDGPVDLDVRTGAGNISVRTGSAGALRVHATIRVSSRRLSESEAADRVRRIEANPPVEQTGNMIRIGQIEDRELRENLSISFEIVAPADTRLRAQTGSGNQALEGLRGPVDASTGSGNLVISAIGDRVNATTGSGGIELNDIKGRVKATTGSGGIRAAAIAGAFSATTGSGNVRVSQTAPGDVEVGTGSGSIDVAGARGGLRAHSGSGSVTVDGEPVAEWRVEVASGNIRMRLPTQAAFDLQARTGSGRISIDHPLTVRGQLSPRRIEGRVRNGGVLVALSTASGNITIE